MTDVPVLDLHGVTHDDVILIVEEWAIMWDCRSLLHLEKKCHNF